MDGKVKIVGGELSLKCDQMEGVKKVESEGGSRLDG